MADNGFPVDHCTIGTPAIERLIDDLDDYNLPQNSHPMADCPDSVPNCGYDYLKCKSSID